MGRHGALGGPLPSAKRDFFWGAVLLIITSMSYVGLAAGATRNKVLPGAKCASGSVPVNHYTMPCINEVNCSLPVSERWCIVAGTPSLPIDMDITNKESQCIVHFPGNLWINGDFHTTPNKCVLGGQHSCGCDVVIRADGMINVTAGTFVAPSITFEAPVIVFANHTAIEVQGTGPLTDNIFNQPHGGGGGHAGPGGICQGGYQDPARGDATRPTEYGGPGFAAFERIFPSWTPGGGRVLLNATQFLIPPPKINADGGDASAEQLIGAGAGGSILIVAGHIEQRHVAIYTANGGSSPLDAAGSGGRIAVTANTGHFVPIVSVRGGRGDTYNANKGTCGDGASGTAYQSVGGQGVSLACIGQSTDASAVGRNLPVTAVAVGDETTRNLAYGLLEGASVTASLCNLDMTGNALPLIESLSLVHSQVLVRDRLHVRDDITMSSLSYLTRSIDFQNYPLNITAHSLSLAQSLISFSSASHEAALTIEVSSYLLVDRESYVQFTQTCVLKAATLSIENDVSEVDLSTDTRLMLVATESVSLALGSKVDADFVLIGAPTVDISGTVTAAGPVLSRCSLPAPIPHNCSMGMDEASFEHITDISLLIKSDDLLISTSAKVQGAAMHMCVENATVGGILDASSFGCGTGKGPSPGERSDSGSCSGAGHAGKGGSSDDGSAVGGHTYGSLQASGHHSLMGSGGGCAGGGIGGGVVHMFVNDTFMFGGRISADGGKYLENRVGGGGSGGTVVVQLARLNVFDVATITAAGGVGSSGSGAGAGGVIQVVWANNYTEYTRDSPDATLSTSTRGGYMVHGTSNQDGGRGAVYVQPTCSRGREGLECRLCTAGYFKNTEGPDLCEACPPGKFSSGRGALRCDICGAGNYSSVPGSSKCGPCPAGLYRNKNGTSCDLCIAGHEPTVCGGAQHNVDVQLSCKLCRAGTYKAEISATCCHDCPAGNWSTPGQQSCSPCGPGRYASGPGKSVCLACSPGSVPKPDRRSCSQCQPGTGVDLVTYTCVPCQQNTAVQDPSTGICDPCPIGDYSVPGPNNTCLSCGALPNHATYDPVGGAQAIQINRCKWTCDPGYVRYKKHCMSLAQVVVLRAGGYSVLITLTVVATGMALIPEILRRKRGDRSLKRRRSARSRTRREHEMTGVRFTGAVRSTGLLVDAAEAGYAPLADWGRAGPDNDISYVNTGKRRQNKSKRRKKKGKKAKLGFKQQAMTAVDLEWHVHRLYFEGRNSARHPMTLLPDAPPEIASLIIPHHFAEYAETVSSETSWTKLYICLYRFFTVVYYPLSALLLRFHRKSAANAVLLAHAQYDYSFLRDTRARALASSLKIAMSADGTMGWLDVLAEQGEDTGGFPVGQPRSPVVLACCGDGGYLTPWQLDISDSMVSGAAQMLGLDWKDKLITLNGLLRTLPRGAIANLAELRSIQMFLTLTNEETGVDHPEAPVMFMGIVEPEGRFPRVALLLLPREVAVGRDGSYPYHLPYNTQVIAVKTRRTPADCGKVMLSLLSFPLRNTRPLRFANWVGPVLGLLIVADGLLGLLLQIAMAALQMPELYLVVILPPGASLLAPLVGIAAQISDSSDVVRYFAIFNVMALFSACVAALAFLAEKEHIVVFEKPSRGLTLMFPAIWIALKLLIAALVNAQAALLDNLRDRDWASEARTVRRITQTDRSAQDVHSHSQQIRPGPPVTSSGSSLHIESGSLRRDPIGPPSRPPTSDSEDSSAGSSDDGQYGMYSASLGHVVPRDE